ncbi:hypothetical protein [Nonomuraea sp. SYSU D8015]|uniref:hypothetical protein n=1 Tax=Nonomuraea sp. SYSU D8015 TaxID=2593644 RepID=UPI001660A26C|nr:hypothetical protein [Nonomuraea sp. SYSU D8015]
MHEMIGSLPITFICPLPPAHPADRMKAGDARTAVHFICPLNLPGRSSVTLDAPLSPMPSEMEGSHFMGAKTAVLVYADGDAAELFV